MNRSSVEISVIVPFLNEEKYIEQCIASLLNQDMEPASFELIFIDNNSTDSSSEIVSKYPSIKLTDEKRPHVYVARNSAIKFARGNILAFTDADCTVSKNWLSSILKEIQANKADIVLGKRDFSPEASFMSKFMRDYENSKIEFILANQKFSEFFGFTNNMAVRKQVYDQLEGFREDIPLGDTDFVLRYVETTEIPQIHFSADAKINHLEIVTWSDWLRKSILYGKESPGSEIQLHISYRGHYKQYLYSIRKYRYSAPEIMLFLLSAACSNFGFLISFLLNGGKISSNSQKKAAPTDD